MKKILPIITALIVLLAWTGWCWAGKKPIVFVSIVPQKFFLEQLAEDVFDVEVMVRPGASPATYEPKPSQMAKLSLSLAYFAIGVPFERSWLGKISGVNPRMLVVHTDKDIDKITISKHRHEDNEHHGHGKVINEYLDHEILDPHIWLSPRLVKKQAETILTALKIIAPEHSHAFEGNFKSLLSKIDVLDSELRETFAHKEGMQFMVFHPSWGYLADEYKLEQVAIEFEGKKPKPAQLKELILHARENDINVIFAQPQFSLKNARLVAREIEGQVITADPLAHDWFTNLRDVAAKFQSAAK